MSANLEHIQQVMAEADILFTAEQVQAAVDQVAEQINQQQSGGVLCDEWRFDFFRKFTD